jgi:hypothetical protein
MSSGRAERRYHMVGPAWVDQKTSSRPSGRIRIEGLLWSSTWSRALRVATARWPVSWSKLATWTLPSRATQPV